MPFSAANYSAAGGGTWTVGASAIIKNRYRINGKTLFWYMYISWFSGGNTQSGFVPRMLWNEINRRGLIGES